MKKKYFTRAENELSAFDKLLGHIVTLLKYKLNSFFLVYVHVILHDNGENASLLWDALLF